jgi:hypothetical protein
MWGVWITLVVAYIIGAINFARGTAGRGSRNGLLHGGNNWADWVATRRSVWNLDVNLYLFSTLVDLPPQPVQLER